MLSIFLQLQAGEILRSSNISSTAADLLQARQQITLYQQQLDERDAQVRGHQEKMQEQLLLIAQLQERLSEAERVSSLLKKSAHSVAISPRQLFPVMCSSVIEIKPKK